MEAAVVVQESYVVRGFPKIPVLLSLLFFVWMTGCEEDVPPVITDPVDSLQIIRDSFASPDVCATCHPTHFAEWETSMHAYAIEDPVFLRLNEIGQERSGNSLDQFCVKCHTPLGSLLQETAPGFDPNGLTSLAKSSIHCDVCHRISSFDRGRAISGFDLEGIRKGPIQDPVPNGFHESEFDSRYINSGICSPCHDILSDTGLLVEATSTEWTLSPYGGMGLECQACHMPSYSGEAASGGPVRNVHRHFFVGVDYPLTDFPGKENTIAMVDELLKNSVRLDVNVPASVQSGSPLNVSVSILNNLTGHNIPSGSAFERQMWIEVVVSDLSDGSVLYSSGLLDDNQDLMNHHSAFVQSGEIPEDTDLVLFNNIPLKDGEETLFFWEADEIQFNSIPAFQTVTSDYIADELKAGTTVSVAVRLRFRTFPPYLFREIGLPELLGELRTFEMAEFSSNVTVLP